MFRRPGVAGIDSGLYQQADREELVGWLSGEPKDPKEKIKAVTAIFDALSIKAVTEKKIRNYYTEAIANLENLNRPEERKKELYNFASFLMNRNR